MDPSLNQLLEQLHHSDDPQIQIKAVELLGKSKSPAAIDPLMHHFMNRLEENTEVTNSIVLALYELSPELGEQLKRVFYLPPQKS